MNNQYSQLDKIIKNSKNILISAHRGIDDDAIGSTLALLNILRKNFPRKNIFVNFEDSVNSKYSFLKGFKKVTSENMRKFIKKNNIDLVFFLDGKDYGRFVTEDPKKFAEFLLENKIKKICIDHHKKENYEDFDLYIRKQMGSTAEIIYTVFTKGLKYKIDTDIVYCLMVGLLGDTGRFLLPMNLKQSFSIAKELISFDPSMIENITNKMGRISEGAFEVFKVLVENTRLDNTYTYSFITDKGLEELKKKRVEVTEYKIGQDIYTNNYLRSINDNYWGFIVIPDFEEEGRYKVSFRATNGTIDTTVFSTKYPGGGGHVPASGCNIDAQSIDEAITIIKKCTEDNIDRARL